MAKSPKAGDNAETTGDASNDPPNAEETETIQGSQSEPENDGEGGEDAPSPEDAIEEAEEVIARAADADTPEEIKASIAELKEVVSSLRELTNSVQNEQTATLKTLIGEVTTIKDELTAELTRARRSSRRAKLSGDTRQNSTSAEPATTPSATHTETPETPPARPEPAPSDAGGEGPKVQETEPPARRKLRLI